MPTPIPARQVLSAAEETNRRLGHENLGFLSESHGFMPWELPSLALPPSHQGWDEMAAHLPEMFRTLTLRASLERMPLLSAAKAALPEQYLLRASAIFSIFAHAYYYVEPVPPAGTPLSIQQPWEEISRRLDRPAPHLSFIDLNVYNWRLLDPACPDPMRVENLALLIPLVGNEDERRFQTTPIEMLARSAPAVGLVVRAQEAVIRDDAAGLKQVLRLLIHNFNELTYDSFPKVNPNPYSQHYVNPVVWGKTVAPLATPYQTEGPPGPSGTAIPVFQLLDIFFGRQTYGTSIGHETARTRPWFPRHWQEFLAAVEQISIPDYVAESRDLTLKGIFQEARDAYAGDTGLLGRHRLKTYGFLDLSFKAGRSKTLGGFGGGFDDRLWDKMDGELNLARLERYTRYPQSCHHVQIKGVQKISAEGAAWVSRVTLEAGQTGIRYQPGDRAAILPENSETLVEATLQSLHARGDEPVQLNATWREAIKLRDGYQQARVLSLRTLLKFGHIRPVTRPVAKMLYSLTHNETLRRIIEARAEDQWELWELLALVAHAGINPKRFWKASPGERESICWLVPPEAFRMYSISSVMADPEADSATEIDLTIGRLSYRTKASDVSADGTRFGASSNFLTDDLETASPKSGRLSLKLVHPPRFSLPKDVSRPVVMLAGGTGLAPFRSLIQERARQADAGETWLFFATRNGVEFYYQEEFAQWVAEGKLHLRVACSREELQIRSEGGRVIFEAGQRQHLNEAILQAETACHLWRLLQSREEGGLGAYFYICGRTGFAKSVMEAIKTLLESFSEGPETIKQEKAHRMLYRLIGEDRYMQEIFTTYTGPQFEQPRVYDASEVVCHNNDQEGYWMIISGRVYDLTEFAHIHPGGIKIIASYAGLDATTAYQKVLHDVNPEVDAMLGMVEIGVVRRLDFGRAWSVTISRQGLQIVSLKDIYRAWIGGLYMIVEMENALHNDYGVRHEPVTYDESPNATSLSPYKIQLLLQTHQRFMHEYLAKLTGDLSEQLWTLTSGLHSEHLHVRWMAETITTLQQSAAAQVVFDLPQQLTTRFKAAGQTGAAADLQWCIDCCAILEAEDKRLMREVKLALRSGVQLFEQFEGETLTKGSKQLLSAVKQLPELLENYYKRVRSNLPVSKH
jgi:sulfite reductase alpha subunit-like flavoprotein